MTMHTEDVDPRYVDLDRWDTARGIAAMWEGQMTAIAAIGPLLAPLAAAADAAATRLGTDGRLVYAGAGTSGRVAVQDGVELHPTYGWPTARVAFLLAGGSGALVESVEGAEDDADAARKAADALVLTASDVVIGVAASGRTRYTRAVIDVARGRGALTIGVCNNRDGPIALEAEHGLAIETGSEVVAGSTRMKAGTAQKAALNMLSTAIMVRRGHVYRGMMVDMRASNEKLRARATAMVASLAGVDAASAVAALEAAGMAIKPAVLIARGADAVGAAAVLRRNGGDLRRAIEAG